MGARRKIERKNGLTPGTPGTAEFIPHPAPQALSLRHAARLGIFLALLLCLQYLSLAQVVCIDPGHPSEIGEGTTGKKLTEMHANWIEALLLKKRLERKGITVYLTKDAEKQFVRNKARAEAANRVHADLMIRLHCDSASGSGYTTYCPAQQGTDHGFRGPSSEIIRASWRKGKAFHAAFVTAMNRRLRDNGLKGDQATAVGGKHGALIGSIYSKVPVVLVEMVVLTNRNDETFMLSKSGQETMADALAAGVFAALKAK